MFVKKNTAYFYRSDFELKYATRDTEFFPPGIFPSHYF